MFLNILSLVLPMLLFIELEVIGRIFLPELILAALLPFLLLEKGPALKEKLPKTFLWLGFFWLCAQVGTDIYRETPFADYSRGWAKIALTMANFCSIYLILDKKPGRIALFLYGIAAAGVLSYFLNPGQYAIGTSTDNYWKFGFAWPVTFLCLAIIPKLSSRNKAVAPLVFFILGTIHIVLGFRSLGLLCFVALIAHLLTSSEIKPKQGRAFRGIKYAFYTAMVIVSFSQIYSFAIGNDIIDNGLAQKTEWQSGEFGILLGGRAEAYVSLQAILDSPLIGHGSWARNRDYALRILDLQHYGYFVQFNEEKDLIPTHSHLFGAWVETGIVGALFWAWILFILAVSLKQVPKISRELAPIAIFISVSLMWDIFFSPFGAERRVTNAFFISTILLLISQSRNPSISMSIDSQTATQSSLERTTIP